jgi:hypothetical protein
MAQSSVMLPHPKAVQTLKRHSAITLTVIVYGHLFTGQDAESVHRLPDMIQWPTDLQPTTCRPVAGPMQFPTSRPEAQRRLQHPEYRPVPLTAT